MNRYNIKVTDVNGQEYSYYVESGRTKKELASDINEAWNKNTGIQVNYLNGEAERIAIFDNKKVLKVDIQDYIEKFTIHHLANWKSVNAGIEVKGCEGTE